MRKLYQTKVISQTVMENAPKIDCPEVIEAYWQNTIVKDPIFDPEKEFLVVFNLNTRYNLKNWNIVSMGSVNESLAHPREIFRNAVASAAYAIVIVHNHPSGDSSPSEADHRMTRRIHQAGEILCIKVLDSIIIGNRNRYSFKEAGIL